MPFGATNQPGTCLWCGRKVRKRDGRFPHSEFFDTGSCGENFGIRLAELGHRFKPVTPQEVVPDDRSSG